MKKADLLEKAKELNLEVTEKNTVAEIKAAIEAVETKTETAPAEEAKAEEVKAAKAGKRSEKALREAKEEAERLARKEAGDTSPTDPEAEELKKKGPKPKIRPLIERRGKSYRNKVKDVDTTKAYTLEEAIKLVIDTNPVKFDASVELHARLGVDPRQADQNIRATVSLPNGTGKTIRVAVLAPESDHAAAKKAGADVVGEDEVIKMLEKEDLSFDTLITTPQLMPKLGKFARLLGPRGLMPNPKSGTVSTDVAKAVTEAKAGKVEYRVDKQSIVHLAFGKVSFGPEKLSENLNVVLDSLKTQKPSSIKGTYVKSLTLTSTMGPGIKVETPNL